MDEKKDTITVSEYIEEQERLEKEAKELFPKKFDVCSNSMGYIRQPVYSCLTCNPNPSEEAGFCYSCSISCHGDHNLVELFTKRSFRCDCGTAKFKDLPCKLDPKPAGIINESNQYNHNYLGRFCWCDILYDPSKEENTMLQCVVCEDWFHDTCIGISPHNDDFDDFICRSCTRAHPFIRKYAQHPLFMIGVSDKEGGSKSVTMVDCSKGKQKNKVKEEDISGPVDVTTVEENSVRNLDTADSSTIPTVTRTTETTTKTETAENSSSSTSTTATNTTVHVKRSLEVTDQDQDKDKDPLKKEETSESSSKRVKLEVDSVGPCKLDLQPEDAYPEQEVNLFATEGWRDLLCQCPSCLALYTKENVPFILGEEAIYEDDEDEDEESSILESGMKKLSEMDRVQMMDGMLAYSKMRDEIRSFLAPFSEQGKVVTEEDVRAFFTAKAEQRAALGGKPNFF
ncbi:E3 ubiquitin-protein ligase UBR7 [Entomortierella parvispora]|uniref:E3 ubiquitin-protein ligase UBR7 n=1 Tax=Entomortierella parvispora TaxID=205924 RepID=A0A9P3LU71_9FUNG|nr:E3 ubiquitin-protein ligase UBR7 [Entomortierella parvispora]